MKRPEKVHFKKVHLVGKMKLLTILCHMLFLLCHVIGFYYVYSDIL